MAERSRNLVRRWFVQPLISQLKQGATPSKLALTLAVGMALGVFPILGSTTLLCLLAGAWLRLNQPVLQLFNYFLYPVQIALIPVFIRIGERLFHAPPMPFSVSQLLTFFKNDPAAFLRRFGMAGVHGIAAWALIAPALAVVAYRLLVPALRGLARAAGLEGDPA